ncbi:hypothetical protein L798_12020 [Zootermopsis nevadensis]|uniref:Uncharacterized protein n=1 Tax=Zootermopsis nevadensis TaxID=136037 RepID=A0A067R4N2_ZOONE|nr:hypothetical protein L798_12020 [Zootermopsis nevadensis]
MGFYGLLRIYTHVSHLQKFCFKLFTCSLLKCRILFCYSCRSNWKWVPKSSIVLLEGRKARAIQQAFVNEQKASSVSFIRVFTGEARSQVFFFVFPIFVVNWHRDLKLPVDKQT